MPSFRALECLIAVADTGSITQAALLLHSSQPAVSHQIASLEREASTALLRREARGVRLTAAGRAAVADARRAVEAATAAVRSARGCGGTRGRVASDRLCAKRHRRPACPGAPRLAPTSPGSGHHPARARRHGRGTAADRVRRG
ncbi:LysR family transcriptional regulator [Streptomyces sp. B3I7]|uniref:helix-turn-helix domain-containing protein n=1 Tax=Streptomyces sp. B3I7 TaxID=3042269 RepID=UPI0027D7D56A|nr:LysR family transcriptional regulator [Streptomyces sp. B3I7]